MNVHASYLAILMLLSQALAINAEDKVTTFPAKIENMAIAQGGRSIVLKLADESGLRIYDVSNQTLRNLDLGTPKFVFGAGGQKIVVFSQVSNSMVVYDVTTLKPIKERAFFDYVALDHIVMGTERDDMAFITLRSDIENRGSIFHKLFDLKRMSIFTPKTARDVSQPNSFYDNRFHMRTGTDLQVITIWRVGTSPMGIGMWKQVSGAYDYVSAHSTADYLAVGTDERIYTGYGVIYDFPTGPGEFGRKEPVEVARIPQRSLFPSVTGRFFLSLGLESDLKLHQFGISEPLCDMGEFPGKVFKVTDESILLPRNEPNFTPSRLESDRPTPEFMNTRMTLDRRITMVPGSDSIVFIPYSNDRLVHRKMDIRRHLDETGKDYCVVMSAPTHSAKAGTEWTYKIQAIAKNEPLTFSVQKAPRQMQVSKEGEVRWPIESGISGSTDIVIEIKDTKGNVTPHKFAIEFD
jgi:hypothetical protein